MSDTGNITSTPTIVVRHRDGGDLLEWRPASGSTRVGELIRMLEDRSVAAAGGAIDLIEQSSGRPLDPDSSVDQLAEPALVATERFLSYALRQLEAFKSQYPSTVEFHSTPGSPVVAIELRFPGLVQDSTPDGPGLRLQGRHELLMVLPRSFPDAPPRMIWLTPIFHPNIVQDRDSWPPGFDWAEQPSLVALLGGIAETLVGLKVDTGGWRSFLGRRSREARASAWFRKHRRAVALLGSRAVHGNGEALGDFPPASSNGEWLLEGALAGGGPVVLLSHRFRHGYAGMSESGPGWLIGRQGEGSETRWIYVHRIVPYIKGAAPPATAVGFSRGPAGGPPPPPASGLLLIAEARDGRPAIRLGPQAEEVGGYFVRHEAPADAPDQNDHGDRIRIESRSAERRASAAVSSDVALDGEGTLVERTLAHSRCGYCGSSRNLGLEWGACPDCRLDTHVECSEQLGGCPNVGCRRSPLYAPRQ